MKIRAPYVGLIAFGLALAYFCPLKSVNPSHTSRTGLTGDDRQFKSPPQSSLSFEAHQGQASRLTGFLSRGNGYGLFLTSTEATFTLSPPAARKPLRLSKENPLQTWSRSDPPAPPVTLKMELIGASREAVGLGLGPLPGRSNYFLGNDQRAWRTNIPHYASVRYQNVYPGVSLVYYGNQRQLEYDFVIAPGAAPGQIKLAFEGAQQVSIDENGALVLGASAGAIRQHKPVVYQEVDGARREIAGRYVLQGERQVGFEVGEYDRTRELVIDPVLIYSTYLGGLDDEYGNGVQADAAGNTYVTGVTYSTDFLTRNPMQSSLRGFSNAFVSKFDSAGRLVYSTYLGGNSEDVGFAITADAAGNVYVAGGTDSSNFPITPGAVQSQLRGQLDIFVAKLNPDGNALLYSAYLGGALDDIATSIAVDSSGNIYLTGETLSTNFPTRNPLQASIRGISDAYVVKLNSTGSQIVYSTYLGGTGKEIGYGIAVDASGAAYVTGFVSSTDFPTRNPAQPALAGRVDAFLTKLEPAGAVLVYSTYFGGSLDDGGFGVGVDGAGAAYLTGFTTSTNFPTKNPFQANNAGGDDAIVAKFDANGGLIFSSYLGGSGEDRAFNLAVDSSGAAYVIGRAESTDFPVKDAFQPQLNVGAGSLRERAVAEAARPTMEDRYGRDSIRLREEFGGEANPSSSSPTTAVVRDGFLAKISATGAVVYSSFLGGSDEEIVFGVAVDNQGNAYVTGITASGNFPTKSSTQRNLKGAADAFVTKIADSANTQTSVSAASYVGPILCRLQIVAAFGSGLSDTTRAATAVPLPTTLDDVSLKVIDSAGTERLAPLFFISPPQINYVMPDGTANGAARIQVIRNGVIVSTETVQIETIAPGIFSANATGDGVAAAVVLRVKADGSQSFEPVAQLDSAQNKYVPAPIDLGSATSGDQVYLILFATGLRNRNSLAGVVVNAGGTALTTLYAGAQGDFVGLDQINLGPLPRSLAGRGEVDMPVVVDNKIANTVKASFR